MSVVYHNIVKKTTQILHKTPARIYVIFAGLRKNLLHRPPIYTKTQRLHVVGDAEIAAALEISEGTVKSRISRAKMRLRELLDGSGNLFDGGAVLQTEISERRERP